MWFDQSGRFEVSSSQVHRNHCLRGVFQSGDILLQKRLFLYNKSGGYYKSGCFFITKAGGAFLVLFRLLLQKWAIFYYKSGGYYKSGRFFITKAGGITKVGNFLLQKRGVLQKPTFITKAGVTRAP